MGAADTQNFVAGLAAKYGSRLRRFLKLNLANASDVPDLAQEVFMRALAHQPDKPRSWVFAVAANIARDARQSEAAIMRLHVQSSADVGDIDTAVV